MQNYVSDHIFHSSKVDNSGLNYTEKCTPPINSKTIDLENIFVSRLGNPEQSVTSYIASDQKFLSKNFTWGNT